jgi:hypothetical protein
MDLLKLGITPLSSRSPAWFIPIPPPIAGFPQLYQELEEFSSDFFSISEE